jgi:energy-coupling factor transporter transmembrane protein EcfT
VSIFDSIERRCALLRRFARLRSVLVRALAATADIFLRVLPIMGAFCGKVWDARS